VTTPVIKKHARRAKLSFRDRKWLLTGQPGALVYLSRDRDYVAALWAEYGEYITARHLKIWPGSRPINWWRYDCHEALRDDESRLQFLDRMNLLTPPERRRLKLPKKSRTLACVD
jgi:hypothetical protein